MNEEKWKEIKQFYLDNFNISGDTVDLLADNDILLMSAAGASNVSISSLLNVDLESVNRSIKHAFDFDGWPEDLEISPFVIFNSLRNEGKYLFKDFEKMCYPIKDQKTIQTMYRICKKYERICILLDKEWK